MQNLNNLFFIGSVIIVFSINVTYSQNSIFKIIPSLDYASLGRQVEILEDSDGDLNIDDVISPEFSKQFFQSEVAEPGFGFTSSVYWIKLTINNPQELPVEWYLEIGYPLIDYVDLYIPLTGNDYELLQTGDCLPFDSRDLEYRNFIFNLRENPNSTRTYYLRFKSSSSMNIPLNFWSKKAFLEKISSEQILLGIYYGAILIMIVYSIFLFIGFREKSYVYLISFIAAFGLLQLALNGLAFQYLWPNWIWWANISIPFLIFSALLSFIFFGRSILDLKKNAPIGDKIVKVEYIFCGTGLFFSLFLPYALMIKIATASTLITVLILSMLGIKIAIKQVHKPAVYFISAFGIYSLAIILYTLKTFAVLQYVFLKIHFYSITLASYL